MSRQGPAYGAALFLFLVHALWSMAAVADVAGQVVKMRGNATLMRGDASVPLALGNLLEPGDQVSTDTGGRLKIQYVDGSTTTLGEDSTLMISNFEFNAESRQRDATLWLRSGIVNIVTATSGKVTGNSRFVVHTKDAFAATRGTEWIVIAGPESSDICVLKGQVSVGLEAKSRRAALTAGAGTWVPVTTQKGIGKTFAIPGDVLAKMQEATAALGEAVPYDPAAATPLAMPEPSAAPEAAPEPAQEKKEDKPFKFRFYERTSGKLRALPAPVSDERGPGPLAPGQLSMRR